MVKSRLLPPLVMVGVTSRMTAHWRPAAVPVVVPDAAKESECLASPTSEAARRSSLPPAKSQHVLQVAGPQEVRRTS